MGQWDARVVLVDRQTDRDKEWTRKQETGEQTEGCSYRSDARIQPIRPSLSLRLCGRPYCLQRIDISARTRSTVMRRGR
jgi:hypothetical protein